MIIFEEWNVGNAIIKIVIVVVVLLLVVLILAVGAGSPVKRILAGSSWYQFLVTVLGISDDMYSSAGNSIFTYFVA